MRNIISNFGPVISFINSKHLQFYKEGVIDEGCEDGTNIAVLIIGYGNDDPGKNPNGEFWIVKGCDANYDTFKIARNKNNLCGIGIHNIVPKLTK